MEEVDPQDLLKTYLEEGREGLIEKLCIFDDHDDLNLIMEEIVDNTVAAFKGEIPINSFLERMDVLNSKLYDEICDAALDGFSEGELNGADLAECLDDIKNRKAKMDELKKK